MSTTHPYRAPCLAAHRPKHGSTDPLLSALRVSKLVLLIWAALRVAACTFRGFGFEGCLALVIVLSLVVLG
jgi:hypothetical protein